MRAFPHAVCATSLLLTSVAVSLPANAARVRRWEVTVAIHVEGGTKKPLSVRLALPTGNPTRRITGLELTPRGLTSELHQEEDEAYVLFKGSVRESRRVAATFIVDSHSFEEPAPTVVPVAEPLPDVLPYLMPEPLFQSRSILVREFLETNVGPIVKSGETDLLRAIYDATRAEIKWRRDGKTLTLDVIRSRHGKRIGIERAFTTFMRCAGIPARFVEGINLDSTTKQKRVFWTELWADGRWWPVSASRGWIGRLPISYVGLTRNNTRVVQVEGPGTASHVVHARRLRAGERGDL